MKNKAAGFWWNLPILFGLLIFLPTSVKAFALLGPIQPWMQVSNNVIQMGDIGGPMTIGNGYRWNVPVVTYGFDQSFLDYFGTNGVAAVESAIKIINNLPPASQIIPANYPFDSRQVNYAAENQQLLDLKSRTLSLLLEHLGLAQPTRYVWVLKRWNPNFVPYSQNLYSYNWPTGTIPDYVDGRNFDSQTFNSSVYVNNIFYIAFVGPLKDFSQYLSIFSADPLAATYNAVADFQQDVGVFYAGLTFDDVAGLRYLLSTNNYEYELLLPGVTGFGTNANSFVNGAWRAGVNKITFVLQPTNNMNGLFLRLTNVFTETYLSNGIVRQQQVARVTSSPDFLFKAEDLHPEYPFISAFDRTGTTNWINNAAINGNPGGDGPGVIQPTVVISFNKIGRCFASGSNVGTTEQNAQDLSVDYYVNPTWGSFDASANSPLSYLTSQSKTNRMVVRLWLCKNGLLTPDNPRHSFDWSPSGQTNTAYTFQTSSDLINWIALFTITNNGSVNYYFNYGPASQQRFYRLLPQ